MCVREEGMAESPNPILTVIGSTYLEMLKTTLSTLRQDFGEIPAKFFMLRYCPLPSTPGLRPHWLLPKDGHGHMDIWTFEWP